MSSPEAISQGDAAARLGISRATVERWVNQGRLNTIRTGQRGGARRVLVDETFHAAQNASSKIPHTPPNAATESLTEENPSPKSAVQIPHPHASHSRQPRAESLTDRDEAALPAADSAAPTSLVVDIGKSLAATTEQESLTSAEANLEPDATTVNPSTQRPSRHSFDADLVPLTGPSVDAQDVQAANPGRPRRHLERPNASRAQAAIAALILVAAAAGLQIYQPWQHSTPSVPTPIGHHAAVHGGHARTISAPRARNRTPATARARGGPARLSQLWPRTPPIADQHTTTAATPGANATTTPTGHPPAHSITPCQSAGICVR